MIRTLADLKERKRILCRELKRVNRIARLHLITVAYDYFTRRRMYALLSGTENNYRQAELFSELSNFIFSETGKQSTPQDFIYDSNEMTDKSIDCHRNYKQILRLIDTCPAELGLNSKTVDALCRTVEYGYKSRPEGTYRYKCFMFKAIGHVQYPEILSACIACTAGQISTGEFKQLFVWPWLTMKKEPVNIRIFVRQMIEIEDLYREIEGKQNNRLKNV